MSDGDFQLPPGFRFHPTDEELVTHYLCRRCAGHTISAPIITEIDLYKYNPWQLPGLAAYGEKEWYFFSPRDRKYPNGSRPNRTAGLGYWKATGADKAIGSPKPAGIKKALVFYAGKAPRGEKTNWIMHEYRLADVDRSAQCRRNSLRLDDWVLCRIYNKKGGTEMHVSVDPNTVTAAAPKNGLRSVPKTEILPKLEPVPEPEPEPRTGRKFVYFDQSESMPRLHADSSCSEQVMSLAADFKSEKEVQSQPRWRDWAKALELPINSGGEIGAFPSQFESKDPLQDIFMYLQKPF